MLKEARDRLETLGNDFPRASVPVAYFKAIALAIAQAADSNAPSRLGVLRCFRTFARLAEPKSTPRAVASPSALLVRTEPKADSTWLRLAVQ